MMKGKLSPRTRRRRARAVKLFTGKSFFDDVPKSKRAEQMYKDLVQGIKNWGTTGYLLRNKKFLQAQSKKNLINFIMFLGNEYYKLYKSKLPRLRKTRQKALPKRKTKRKFSAKQLAAQRLFAKRARAGTLRKRKR